MVAFSIGMNLIKTHPNKKLIVILLIALFSLTTPIGGTIGIIVQVLLVHLLFFKTLTEQMTHMKRFN